MNSLMWWCYIVFLGHVVFAGKCLGLPVEADQILVRSRLGIRLRLIGLEVKPAPRLLNVESRWCHEAKKKVMH